MIENFEQMIDGQKMRFCASLGEDESAHRVIISRDDSAETLVVFDTGGCLARSKPNSSLPAN